ncbi:MAG: heme o synthase [Verrucomicrobia bacterium]|nr:heme o synthase [Verrucomicrobiota bacterium]
MKARVTSLEVLPERAWVGVAADLIKARLTFLVLLTTLVGFYLGTQGGFSLSGMVHLLLGTGLLASGAAALNQWLERDHDARMRRTEDRPLPARRLQPDTVVRLGIASAGAGLVYLAWGVNLPAGVLGAVTLLTYLFVYTPLKRVTWLNTIAGAVPGALPPLLGWTAARGNLEGPGWTLFVILALWQIPHFFAIAWMYRDDYARAGFAMLPGVDPTGRRTARQAVVFCWLLLGASLLPWFYGLTGHVYLAGAVVLGCFFAVRAHQFGRERSDERARNLFYASILYLPLLLGLMLMNKGNG